MSELTAEQTEAVPFAVALAAAYEAGDVAQFHDLIRSRQGRVSLVLDLLSAVSQLSQQVEEARA